jgi:hypothetical protein
MRRVSEAVIQDVRKRTAACETGVLHPQDEISCFKVHSS